MNTKTEENKTTDTENARAMTETEPPLDPIPSAPSFSYLAEIVIQEQRTDSNDTLSKQNDNDDDDFEFCFVPRHPVVSADDIFHIRPTYPLFNQNEVVHADQPRRLPLRELMFLERGKVNERNDDLDGVPEGTYCVWTPPCKKTNSSSKRWKLLDLLPRTSSKVAPKHSSSSSAKFVSFFNHAN